MHLFTDINGTVYDTSCSSLDCYGWYFDFVQAAVPRIFSRTSQSFSFALTSSGSSIPVAWMSSAQYRSGLRISTCTSDISQTDQNPSCLRTFQSFARFWAASFSICCVTPSMISPGTSTGCWFSSVPTIVK